MIRTAMTEFFGIQHPIIQGAMMWISRAELVAAAANAGAIGFITSQTFPDAEGLREEIRRCRQMTDKPFGVNLTLLPTLRPPDYPSYIRVCIEEGVKFMETAGKNPESYIEMIKSGGIKVIHKCTSVRHAVKAEQLGCDAIIIDGFEAAGHPGEDDVTSLILIPRTRDAVSVPVIASGGFADGRGLAAALSLGADGVNIGTRFVACQEAPVHPNVKKAYLDHNELDTRLILRTLRNTERVLHSSVVDTVLEIERRGNATIEDLKPRVSGLVGRQMLESGDMERGVLAAGQCLGLVNDVPTCRELIERIVADAEEIIRRKLPGLIRD